MWRLVGVIMRAAFQGTMLGLLENLFLKGNIVQVNQQVRALIIEIFTEQ